MQQALEKAQFWWNASEVKHVFPAHDAMVQFHNWMRMHQLGRKRILDTQLAATLFSAGVRRLFTSNRPDFEIFAAFELISP